MNDEEERLESCKKQEQKQRDEIDKDLRQVDQLKAERLSKKQECDSMEEEVGKARREVGAIAKDVQAAQKQVVSLEGKIESKKSERHNILMQCKVGTRVKLRLVCSFCVYRWTILRFRCSWVTWRILWLRIRLSRLLGVRRPVRSSTRGNRGELDNLGPFSEP